MFTLPRKLQIRDTYYSGILIEDQMQMELKIKHSLLSKYLLIQRIRNKSYISGLSEKIQKVPRRCSAFHNPEHNRNKSGTNKVKTYFSFSFL